MFLLQGVFHLIAFVAVVFSMAPEGSSTLIVYDPKLTELSEYSKFIEGLTTRSHDITYLPINNETKNIDLFIHDNDKKYNHLVLLPVKGKKVTRMLTDKLLLRFVEDGGDILAVTSPITQTDSIRLFLNQLGIFTAPRGSILKNPLQGENDELIKVGGKHILNKYVLGYDFNDDDEFIFSKDTSACLVGEGSQLIPLINAPRTSFTQVKNAEHWTDSTQGFLSVGFQSLNNARVSWIGSQEFLSDKFNNKNGYLVDELTKWTFKEKSILKSFGAKHTHADLTTYESLPYKVGDKIIYEIGISEWNGENWVPFKTDDLQFELKLVDPYYRFNLKQKEITNNVCVYTSGEFKLPDHHGVFTFVTDYKRSGLSFIKESDVKAIRHLANDEYPRSFEISNAWVYLSGIFTVISSWVIFVILFLITGKRNVNLEKKMN
ncbi:hypothetical protein TBLA_0J01740 [Henningerozyma blattae CBS 6284]|uniref:Dolichyl-diphosphooligosaccharide--protein glycosyltransferase subunit WBP1 n=1 Tax=Henningerozyma blattae (strain ATCC 34711 / CBS 6284 / DSM 70876 / NBRC 10599 / NRRL Y-10934 / UCD 77-7) TaxID=1071380 RepID=I2H9W6_HENB6|nr:hypothetical protein TBLA_0J01740 [Tetrapisispora blattae CBS 6284]CCH63168.1 hypothetical protein TBLA_0J01740 [Tetrapisispora blattae CBS 6284]